MRTITLLVLFFGFITLIDAQYYPSRQYMTGDGMPSNSVFDIAQHPSGMMWFVTRSGPVYYDGQRWTTFSDTLNLPSSANSRIVVSDSTVWVAGLNDTTFTIQYYDQSWHSILIPFHPAMENQNTPFNVGSSDSTPLILLGLGNELHFKNQGQSSWQKMNIQDAQINDIIVIDSTNYIATTDGLFLFQNNELQKVRIPYNQLSNTNILTLNIHENKMHLLGYDWYAELEDDSIVFQMDDAGLNPSSRLTQGSLVIDKRGTVFYGAGTPARTINYESKTWQNLLIKGENVNIGSTSIFCDRENNIWVSDSRGLFKYNVLQFINYNKSSGLAADEVTAITQLSDGRMILSNPAQLNILDNDKISSIYLKKDESPIYRVLDIHEDPEHNLVYVAENDASLIVYHRNNFNTPYFTIDSSNIRITGIELMNGKIYVSSDRGIYEIDNKQLKPIHIKNSIRNIKSIGNHLLGLTNANGIIIIRDNAIYQYTSHNYDLSSVYQATIYKGDTILATRGGIGTLSNDKIVHWNKLNFKFPAYSILVDQKERLWIGSDHGVYVYQEEQLKLYDLDDGLVGNEINRNALFEDDKGQIWIGTEKGASVFRENTGFADVIRLNVDITNIQSMNGKSLDPQFSVKLPYDDNGIEISFQCLSYIDESKMNFRYRINETNWVPIPNAGNSITLSNLKDGNYQFEIQSRFGQNEWGPITTYQFSIKKPFYFTWWFLCILFLVLFLLGRILFSIRYLMLIKRQNKLKEEVAARTKEIMELNEMLEEKVRIRTQELENKNTQLEEYAYINAHYLRGPLSKIMSVIHLTESSGDLLTDKQMIKILKEAVEELDTVIYSINDVLNE